MQRSSGPGVAAARSPALVPKAFPPRWSLPSPAALGSSAPTRRRRLPLLALRANAATTADLATYQLHRPSAALLHSRTAAWFPAAVREIVRHLEDSPFLQLVRFGNGDPTATPEFSSYAVPEDVVTAPELWHGVAETVTSSTSDVVILVQRVDPHGAHPSSSSSSIDLEEEAPEPCSCATADIEHLTSSDMRAHVEDACRKLVAAGIGESILSGKVGDCCEEEGGAALRTHTHHQRGKGRDAPSPARPGIVPFNGKQRAAVVVTALPAGGGGRRGPVSGYWGVVVQSRHHTGAEGCYLLKAVRTPANDASGCTCTHFSLTRVCEGENLERQFVKSWLV